MEIDHFVLDSLGEGKKEVFEMIQMLILMLALTILSGVFWGLSTLFLPKNEENNVVTAYK